MPSDLLDLVQSQLEALGTFELRRNRAGELVVDTAEREAPCVVLDHAEGDARAAVVLAFICAESRAEPKVMLGLVGRMGAGGITLVGGAYWVRCTIPVAVIGTAQVPAVIRYASGLASTLGLLIAAQQAEDLTTCALACFAA